MDAWVVILLVMIGGGAAVVIAWAVARNFMAEEKEDNYGMRPQQLSYMRDLRERNLTSLYSGRRSKEGPKTASVNVQYEPNVMLIHE
jgi:hypothetical protein